MLSLLLTALMTIAAFAVDVGSFYGRAAQIQRAADAAALAAVVFIPGDLTQATTVARDTAARNGLTHGSAGVSVNVSVAGDSDVEVEIVDTRVPTYFGRVMFENITVRRSARARYTAPLALGSPLNTFGNQGVDDPDPPNLWAAINAPYSSKEHGDPYAARCITAASVSPESLCNQANPQYRDAGYLYAIDVPADAGGRLLTVEIYDAGYYHRGGVETEESDLGRINAFPPALSYELFHADASKYDLNDNPSTSGTCVAGPGRLVLDPNEQGYRNNWTLLCSLNATAGGRYALRVKSSGIAGEPNQGSASAHYSVRATLSGVGGQPHLFGVGDMSIFTGAEASVASFYLAEVTPQHAGSRLRIELFDPGDGTSGDYFLSIVEPGGTTATCRYTDAAGTLGTNGNCRIQTRVATESPPNRYNGRWLTILVDLPVTYTCTDCWWKVRYELDGTPTDRTTWRASVDGGPIHLVR